MKDFHYFGSHALGWTVGDSVEEVMEKLFCTTYYGKMGTWLKNCQKEGSAGIHAFVCRVPLPRDAKYKIDWFAPKVEGLTETKNLIVTYVTLKKVNWMRDPADEIRQLKADLDTLGIENEKLAFHVPDYVMENKS